MNLDINDIRTACLDTSLRMRPTLDDISATVVRSTNIDQKWKHRFVEEVYRSFTETCAEFFLSDIHFSLSTRQLVVERLLVSFPLHTHFVNNTRTVDSAYLYTDIEPDGHIYDGNPQKLLLTLVILDTKDDRDFHTFRDVLQTVGEQVLNNTPAWRQWKHIEQSNPTTGDFRNFVIAALQSQPESVLPTEFRTAAFYSSLLEELKRKPIEQQIHIDHLIQRMKFRFGMHSSDDKNTAIQKAFDREFYLLHLNCAFKIFFTECQIELDKSNQYFANAQRTLNTKAL